MAGKTKIEWADMTINPIIGCTKCSPGCDRCYAEAFARRLASMSERYRSVCGRKCWTGDIDVDFSCFNRLPKRPKRIFVGSMGDVFHEAVPEYVILELCACMMRFPHHTFMLLTKRPKRMRDMLSHAKERLDYASDGAASTVWPLPNVWLGVTAENQEQADKRIPILLSTPAAKRFVSMEPLLSAINTRWTGWAEKAAGETYRQYLVRNGEINQYEGLKGIHWIIAGGESGFGARPMHSDWVRTIRNQCQDAGVPFMFKQWGEWGFTPGNSATHGLKSDGTLFPCRPGQDLGGAWPCRKMGKRSGCELDGREWKEFPS